MLRIITIIFLFLFIFILGIFIGLDLSKDSVEYNCNKEHSVTIKHNKYLCIRDYTTLA